MTDLGKVLIGLGLAMALVGVGLVVAGRLPWLGQLPGDFSVQRGRWTFYVPLATCLLLSVVLSALLYLFGRREDLAFEQPVGDNPRKRHHVRFWKTEKTYDDGRPIWIGSASYDERVGLSHTTGQITHHIAADVDAERDHLFASLRATGKLADEYPVDDFHSTLEGRNGGGDPWFTDGRLFVGVFEPEAR